MNLSGSFLCSAREKKPKEDKKETSMIAEPGQSSQELNPYWKNGGSGLPEEQKKRKALGMDPEWLKKSLQRAQEQAREEGRSLEEIAAERWGSLDEIKQMIEKAERNSRHSNKSRYESDRQRKIECKRSHRDRSRSRSRSRERYRRSCDDKYDRSRTKLAFKRPDDGDGAQGSSSYSSSRQSGSSKNWRKPEANESAMEETNSKAFSSADRKASPVNNAKLNLIASNDYHMTVQSSSSDSEAEDDEKSPEIPVKILTDDEMNQLGAKCIKAEIMGDVELAAKLKKELEEAREARNNKPKPRENLGREENVILTTTNSRGMARPLEPRSKYQEPQGGRRKNKKVDSHEGGQRVRYFADDDKYSLQDMFQREKGLSANDDDDAAFVKMASKSMDMDELFEERITRGESDAKQDHRDKMRAIKEHQRREKSLDNCRLCVDSKEMQKHLIVALGSKVYLSLPWHVSLTPGHCVIAPVYHVSAQTLLDEDVWEELQGIKKALTKMFTDSNQCAVFFEVYIGRHRYPHMYVECVPLPEEVGSMAPMYFKKALLECEMEWSTNKKVVDLDRKNVRQAIPKGLPYFAVNFGTQGGFAHVIEDEKLFPRNFAQEIIGGMLDLDSHMWRKPRREKFDEQKKKVMEFADQWRKYDCTGKSK